jgi:ArsR family transcriptional regulator
MAGLRAAGEPTRLRLLVLCANSELTVSELTQLLGQSQPRVSRHLKLLCEAGLLDRFREGTWAFYRLAEQGGCAELGRTLVDLVPADDATLARDLERLDAVKQARAEAAASYFSANAARWSEIRSLYVPESDVERALLETMGDREIDDFLDVGTGTGRMLELFAPLTRHGIGIDLNRDMLSIARARLERAQLRHCQVRQGDMYHLPFGAASMDLVMFHLVLHYAEDPAAAIAEAARVLRPGGRLAVVDFLPHDLEYLREQHAHRRLGFADAEVAGWFKTAGLAAGPARLLTGTPLSIGIWTAEQSTRPAP